MNFKAMFNTVLKSTYSLSYSLKYINFCYIINLYSLKHLIKKNIAFFIKRQIF